MEPWILLSVAAALAQTVRFALQRVLAVGALSPLAATWARFFWSAPLVVVAVWGYARARGLDLPVPESAAFWLYAMGGGLAQVLATVATVALLKARAFAVGITFKKTEVMLTALAGVAILGDWISGAGALAIAVGFLGVLLLSEPPEGGGVINRGAALGLVSGVFFALAAIGYRGATLALAGDDTLLVSGVTLALVSLAQAVGVGLWLAVMEPGQVGATLRAWRTSAPVGVLSMIGSWCWLAAFSMQIAAYVFAVGQVELIFSVALGAMWFGERITRREGAGMALLTVSILTLVWVTG